MSARKKAVTDSAAEPQTTAPASKPNAPKQNVIRFKLTRNHMIAPLAPYLTNGLAPTPPASMKCAEEGYVRDATLPSGVRKVRRETCQFDLSHVFEINLPEVEPRTVRAKKGMPAKWVDTLQAKEYERALAAQDKSERLRAILKHFAGPRGLAAIEIVDDPTDFLGAETFYNADELADKRAEDNRVAAQRLTEKAERDQRAIAAMKAK